MDVVEFLIIMGGDESHCKFLIFEQRGNSGENWQQQLHSAED